MKTLVKIRRNQINSTDRKIYRMWPAARLSGFFVEGKPVANRGILEAPTALYAKEVMHSFPQIKSIN